MAQSGKRRTTILAAERFELILSRLDRAVEQQNDEEDDHDDSNEPPASEPAHTSKAIAVLGRLRDHSRGHVAQRN